MSGISFCLAIFAFFGLGLGSSTGAAFGGSVGKATWAVSAFSAGLPFTYSGGMPWLTIVGVVGNLKHTQLMNEMSWVETPIFYRPLAQEPRQSTADR